MSQKDIFLDGEANQCFFRNIESTMSNVPDELIAVSVIRKRHQQCA